MKKLAFALCIVVMSLPQALQAQFSCSGTGCSLLPVSQPDLDRYFLEFKRQYTDVLFDDMAAAAAMSATAAHPTGSVNLYGWTAGGAINLGALEPHDVTIEVAGVGKVEDAPAGGASINPRFMAGFNVGWLFGLQHNPYGDETPSYFSPTRFDIYLSGLKMSRKWDLTGSQPGTADITQKNFGAELRYHLVEGKDLVWGPTLRFLGVSAGLTYSKTKQTVTLFQDATRLKIASSSGVNMFWDGRTQVVWDTSVDTYSPELRTGIQLFYLLNLTAGVGISFNQGSSDFNLTRLGPIVADTNVNELFGVTPPTAALTATVSGEGEVPKRFPYVRLGVGLNLLAVKLDVEALAAQEKIYGANVALRVQF